MSARIQLPIAGQSCRLIPVGEVREAREWADGVAYRDRARKRDSAGRDLFAFPAVVEIGGVNLGTVTVETPQQLPEGGVPLGAVFRGASGTALLSVSNNQGGFDLNVKLALDAFEAAKN